MRIYLLQKFGLIFRSLVLYLDKNEKSDRSIVKRDSPNFFGL